MSTIHIESNLPITVRTYEHLSTCKSTENVEDAYVATQDGVEYHPQVKYIGPSKDDPTILSRHLKGADSLQIGKLVKRLFHRTRLFIQVVITLRPSSKHCITQTL